MIPINDLPEDLRNFKSGTLKVTTEFHCHFNLILDKINKYVIKECGTF